MLFPSSLMAFLWSDGSQQGMTVDCKMRISGMDRKRRQSGLPLAGCKNMFTECLLMLGHRKSVLASTPLFFSSWGHSKVLNAGEGPPTLQSTGHSRMELRPPTAKKIHPNFFAHCKRSTKMKKHKKTIIPNVQITMRMQVTPMVSNYGKL